MAADPIHQFEIHKIFSLGTYGGHEIAFTNSSLYMVIAVLLIALLLVGATAGRSLVPGRMQSLAELSYEFVATTIDRKHFEPATTTRGRPASWMRPARKGF